MLQAEKLLEGELASQQKQNKATESPWPQAMPHALAADPGRRGGAATQHPCSRKPLEAGGTADLRVPH